MTLKKKHLILLVNLALGAAVIFSLVSKFFKTEISIAGETIKKGG